MYNNNNYGRMAMRSADDGYNNKLRPIVIILLIFVWMDIITTSNRATHRYFISTKLRSNKDKSDSNTVKQTFVAKYYPTVSKKFRTERQRPLLEQDPSVLMNVRTRRQLPPLEQGNQVINNIFQIPISTLNAVGSLIKSTRPLVRRTRERIQQYYNAQPSAGAAQFSQQQQQQHQCIVCNVHIHLITVTTTTGKESNSTITHCPNPTSSIQR